MKRTTTTTGAESEQLAAAYLIGRGYSIIKRNFRFGREGEIDIVAIDGQTLVFVEVKARSSHAYGLPEAAVTPAKQRILRRAALGYCYINSVQDRECRFDVIALDLQSTPPVIRHIVNAFQ